jgi:hypothetical protein
MEVFSTSGVGIPEFVVGRPPERGPGAQAMYPQDELDNNFENVADATGSLGNDNINGVMWLLKAEYR